MRSAQGYEFLGQLKRAADVLDDLAVVDRESSEKWLNVSSDFRFLDSDFNRARTGYRKLMNSKDPQISMNAVLRLINIEKQTKNAGALSKLESLARDRRYEPLYGSKVLDYLDSLLAKGSYKTAFEVAREVIGDKKHQPHTRAGARYVQAQILDKEFKEASLVTSPERLTLVLKIKTERLEKAQVAFRDVIKFGDAEFVVKSLRDLSLCYDHYVKAVRNLRFTKALPQEDMDALQEELEKVTLPMEDKAVETISQAIVQAKKLEMRDGIIAQMQNILNGLNLRPIVKQAEVRAPLRVVPLLMGGES